MSEARGRLLYFDVDELELCERRILLRWRYFRGGEHMVDLIVVTFVYIEKLRTDRDNQSQHMATET